MSDQLQRFIFDNSDIRGEIVTLEHSYQDILAQTSHPEEVQRLLGEFLAAAALLSATLKFDGIITLQARSNGPVSMVMADCTRHQNLRAIAQLAEDYSGNPSASFNELLPEGTLAITIDPIQGQRYQGVISLEDGSLNDCLQHYFMQSEQLATGFWLAADGKRASGLLLQQLPQQLTTDAEEYQNLWQHALQLANTLTPEEQLSLGSTEQLYRLYHQDQVRLFDPTELKFCCSCSRERTEKALLSMGEEQLKDLVEELGLIAMDCQFCHQQYRFTAADVENLLSDKPETFH